MRNCTGTWHRPSTSGDDVTVRETEDLSRSITAAKHDVEVALEKLFIYGSDAVREKAFQTAGRFTMAEQEPSDRFNR